MDANTNLSFYCIQEEVQFNIKMRHCVKVKGTKYIFKSNGPKKQAMLKFNKIDFNQKIIKTIGELDIYS